MDRKLIYHLFILLYYIQSSMSRLRIITMYAYIHIGRGFMRNNQKGSYARRISGYRKEINPACKKYPENVCTAEFHKVRINWNLCWWV